MIFVSLTAKCLEQQKDLQCASRSLPSREGTSEGEVSYTGWKRADQDNQVDETILPIPVSNRSV